MRRTAIVALFVLAWTIGPVAHIHDEPVPPTTPPPALTVSR